MTKIILTTILFLIGCSAHPVAQLSAQQLSAQHPSAQRLFRSERPSYTLRDDAVRGVRSESSRFMNFPKFETVDESGRRSAEYVDFTLPENWFDGEIMLHLEGDNRAYSVMINGVEMARIDDFLTPSDHQITNLLKGSDNTNRIEIRYDNSATESPLSSGIAKNRYPSNGGVKSLYIYSEPRRRLFDYDVKIRRDSSHLFAHLEIAAIVENGYNYNEEITVGFDLYHPDGRLLDYSSRLVSIEGGCRDTVRFKTYIYNADSVRWSPQSPELYSVTLLTKIGAVVEGYTPLKVAYSDRELRNGVLHNFGERIEIKPFNFIAKATIEQSANELLRVKDAGYNTLLLDYPQPIWLYDLCDKMGFYIIEQSSINAPQHADNRKIGGSPSNNPWLFPNYIERMAGSYYRVQQHPSVIAFSLGGNSGNGYNMYKLYEWMKRVEPNRPVIYDGAQDEWNSDIWLNR